MVEREIISEFMVNGILLAPEAIDYLDENEDLRSVLLDEARKEKLPTFLSLQEVKSRELERISIPVPEVRGVPLPGPLPEVKLVEPQPLSADLRFQIDRERDITGRSTSEGEFKDFLTYFRARYTTMRRLFRRRRELIGSLPITKAKRMDDVRIIGIVRDIRKGPRSLFVTIEDESSEIGVTIPLDKNVLLMGDEVIGVIGRRRGERVIASEVIFPDVPQNPRNRSKNDAHLLIMSDTHFGSFNFIWDSWRSFVSKMDGMEPKIDCMLIAGDLVDGVGIYPGQKEDLEVKSVYDQYELAAAELDELPHEMKIFLQPGNHDYVRLAEPQPALPEEISSIFSNNIIHIGNPSYINIEGVDILSYHGSGLDDYLPALNIPYTKPLEGMKAMLKRRHLAPLYGGKTPIAPESKDYLVIDKIPDIFVTGHVHGSGAAMYRGVIMVSGSTFQSQTSYQKMMNFVPDPGNFLVLNLRDMSSGRVVV